MTGYITLYYKGELIDRREIGQGIQECEIINIWKYRYGKKFNDPEVKTVTDRSQVKVKIIQVKKPCNRDGKYRAIRNEVIKLILKGLKNKVISKKLKVKDSTVKSIRWRFCRVQKQVA